MLHQSNINTLKMAHNERMRKKERKKENVMHEQTI